MVGLKCAETSAGGVFSSRNDEEVRAMLRYGGVLLGLNFSD